MVDILGLIVFLAFVVAPIARMLRRIGISPLWSLVALVPIVNLIVLNYVAYAGWPFEVVRSDS